MYVCMYACMSPHVCLHVSACLCVYVYYIETPITGGEHPYSVLETLVGKSLSHKLFKDLTDMFTLVKEDSRPTMVAHIVKVLSDLQEILEISIQPQMPKNKQTRNELVGKEEYDNPKPDTTYWNSDWIKGSCACLFCWGGVI